MTKTLDPAITAALTDAVAELELRSCAEVVLEIRARSGSYAHADARFASALAFLALLVLLFSPWPFQAVWVAVDTGLAWILGLFIARKSDRVRRWMTRERERAAQVHTLAMAVFHQRGIANTIAETGVLVYLSQLERRVELLADRGVLQAVPALEWNQLAAASRTHGATTETLLEIVQSLTPLLERHLPAREGDIDELCNVPQFVSD
jgi:putative membrane protein